MKHLRVRLTIILLVLVVPTACGSQDLGQTQTEGARDSAIAESPLPGAGGVRGALSAADSAEARRAIQDSILATPDP